MYQNLNFFKARQSYDQVRKPRTTPAIEPALNNILASVHQRLKYNPKPAVPKIPKAIADTMSHKSPEVLLMGSGNKPKKRGIGRRTISQLQADMDLHGMQAARRVGMTSEMMSFRNQQRYREVLRQKRILENMLKEHQKLQSDRDSIACEINYMRSYLDNIRNKLDVSLRKLNSHKTIPNQKCPNKQARPLPRVNKTVKKTTSPNVTNVKGSSAVKTVSRYPRIAGGGHGEPFATRTKVAPPKNNTASKCTKTITSPCPAKNFLKKWVYCTRIERKGEMSRLL